MKIALQDAKYFVLRLDKDEDVNKCLANFMQEQSIGACSFSGVGSCSSVELGYYNGHVKEYRKKPFFEEMEIISLNGNGAIIQGSPILHIHGLFGKSDFTTIGGHVFQLQVGATCEIFLTVLDGQMQRTENSELNLKLLDC